MPSKAFSTAVCRAGLALAIAALVSAVAGPVEGAVVILSNRTQQAVPLVVQPDGQNARPQTLGPRQLVAIAVGQGLAVDYTWQGKRHHQRLEPNAVYELRAAAGDVVVEQITFLESGRDLPSAADPHRPAPSPVVVPVKLLIDTTAAVDAAGSPHWRERIAAASKPFEQYCRVRFEVVGIEPWRAAGGATSRGAQESLRAVDPQPARLVIGFSRQIRVTDAARRPEFHLEPLAWHLAVPEVQPEFGAAQQHEFLVHQLAHWLGAAHSMAPDSPLRASLGEPAPAAAGPPFDAIDTLVMNLLGEELGARGMGLGRFDQLSPRLRRYLRAIYFHIYQAQPRDPLPGRLLGLVREPATAPARYTAVWEDGTQLSGDDLGPWGDPYDQPRLAGRALFSEHSPVRWVVDHATAPGKEPESFVEFCCGGDRLPGRVIAAYNATQSPAETLPSYLLVAADSSLDRPGTPARTGLRIPTRWVRRVVWQPIASRYQPGTLFHRDGRQSAYRLLRWGDESVRLLREEGVEEVPLAAIAELHLPVQDAWDACFEQWAGLGPGGRTRIVQLETSRGLRVTSSGERFQADRNRAEADPTKAAAWFHIVQPVWSMDPLWVPYGQIRLRRYYGAQRVPLSSLEPTASRRQSILGGAWQWLADRNVQGGPLEAAGRLYGWGFGVQAASELEFTMPACARTFQTRLGLDRAAGEGGCVRAAVLLDAGGRKALYASPLLLGSGEVLDTGPLRLELPAGVAARLVLRAELPGDDRPAQADPWDIRAIFDWLEPQLELDPAQLQAEADRRTTRLIPAWQDWTVAPRSAPGLRLVNYWNEEGPDHRGGADRSGYRLGVVAVGEPLRVSRVIRVSPQRDRLVLSVRRPPLATPSHIEIRVDGRMVGEFTVPEVHYPPPPRGPKRPKHNNPRRPQEAPLAQTPEALEVSLADYRDRQITIEIVQQGQDARAMVDWRRLDVVGSEP